MSLARNTEMFHLDDLNLALIHAGRPPQLNWAASISGAPGSDIPPSITSHVSIVSRLLMWCVTGSMCRWAG